MRLTYRTFASEPAATSPAPVGAPGREDVERRPACCRRAVGYRCGWLKPTCRARRPGQWPEFEDLAQSKVFDRLCGFHHRQGTGQAPAVKDLVHDGDRGFGHNIPLRGRSGRSSRHPVGSDHFDLVYRTTWMIAPRVGSLLSAERPYLEGSWYPTSPERNWGQVSPAVTSASKRWWLGGNGQLNSSEKAHGGRNARLKSRPTVPG